MFKSMLRLTRLLRRAIVRALVRRRLASGLGGPAPGPRAAGRGGKRAWSSDRPRPSIIGGDSELLAETVPPLRGDVNAPVLVALQPAEIHEPDEQGAAQGAGEVRAVFGRVRVVPNGLAARRDHHAERLQEGPSPGGDQVAVLAGVRTRGLVSGSDVAALDEGTHQLDAEGAADVVVTHSGLPPGPGLLALPE